MFALLLSLAVSEPPRFTVTPGFLVTAAKVTPAPPPKAKPAPVRLPLGYHEHVCPWDGTRWGHGSASHGVADDHRCPNCHRLLPSPWHKAPTIKLPAMADCPPGVH